MPKQHIADQLGINRGSVWKIGRGMPEFPKSLQFPAQEIAGIKETQAAVDEMKAAADKYLPREPVEGGFNDDDEPMHLVWQREEERSARKVRKAHEASQFKWRAPGPH